MYDQVVKCQRAGLCLSEHFLIFVMLLPRDAMLYIILARLGQVTGQCDRPGVRLSVTLVR